MLVDIEKDTFIKRLRYFNTEWLQFSTKNEDLFVKIEKVTQIKGGKVRFYFTIQDKRYFLGVSDRCEYLYQKIGRKKKFCWKMFVYKTEINNFASIYYLWFKQTEKIDG